MYYKKGKGLKQAEIDQTLYHAPGIFNKETGEIIKIPTTPDTKEKYQIVFGETICELARKYPKIVGIHRQWQVVAHWIL